MSEYATLTQACLDAWGRSAGNNALLHTDQGLETPCYVYSKARVQQRVQQIRKHIPEGVVLQYAVKANPYPPLLKAMAGWVDGFDIASAGEQQLAQDAGVAAQNISFAGPGKTDAELSQALSAGVCISLESLGEIERLAGIAAEQSLHPRVLIRINPDFVVRASGLHMGGLASPFGMDESLLEEAMAAIHRYGFELLGLHIFAGSQSLDVAALKAVREASIRLMIELDEKWQALGGKPLEVFNIGGGWGIPYFPNDIALPLSELCEGLESQLARLQARNPSATLVLELGRYLVGEGGIYLTRIIDKKTSRGETFLITDGGMNHHLGASGNLGQVIRRNYPVLIANRLDANRRNANSWQTVTIAGPLCTPLDMLARSVTLPKAEVGDCVAIFQSGAYGLSASPQGFLSHPSASEYWL